MSGLFSKSVGPAARIAGQPGFKGFTQQRSQDVTGIGLQRPQAGQQQTPEGRRRRRQRNVGTRQRLGGGGGGVAASPVSAVY